MRLRTLLSLLIPLACAGLFVRLGVWQLSRHSEVAALNQGLVDRLGAAPVPLGTQASDTTGARWLAVEVSGRFRYDLEQVLASRSSRGSPGVHLLTPLERADNDTLLLVTRGWVYAADAATAELPRWRERDSVTIAGYLVPLVADGPPPPPDNALPIRTLSRAAIEARVGAPIAPVQLVMTSDSMARIDSVPRRLPPPVLDAGPHRAYAAQWFAFAIIAVVGGTLLFRKSIVADRSRG